MLYVQITPLLPMQDGPSKLLRLAVQLDAAPCTRDPSRRRGHRGKGRRSRSLVPRDPADRPQPRQTEEWDVVCMFLRSVGLYRAVSDNR